MNFVEFKTSISASAPPKGISEPLQALWYAGKDNWDASHSIAQDIHTETGSWIHAYLHRVEGDLGNAAYWYKRAGKPLCKLSLKEEWELIVRELLK